MVHNIKQGLIKILCSLFAISSFAGSVILTWEPAVPGTIDQFIIQTERFTTSFDDKISYVATQPPTLVPGSTNRIMITNINFNNTNIWYRWTIIASNAVGKSAPSTISATPTNFWFKYFVIFQLK